MAENKRMTQTAIVRELAETTGVNNRVAKHFMESLAQLAVRETKKNGMFVMPGIGRLVRAERKAVWASAHNRNVDRIFNAVCHAGVLRAGSGLVMGRRVPSRFSGRVIARQPMRRHISPNGARSSRANQASSSARRSEATQDRRSRPRRR